MQKGRRWQTFSVKDQMVSILGSQVMAWVESTTPLCHDGIKTDSTEMKVAACQ
jgi:hypothetical protein